MGQPPTVWSKTEVGSRWQNQWGKRWREQTGDSTLGRGVTRTEAQWLEGTLMVEEHTEGREQDEPQRRVGPPGRFRRPH